MEDLPTLHFGYAGTEERTRVWFDNGDSEELLLAPVDRDLYRLEESSFLGEAMYGDVIRGKRREDGGLLFAGVEMRSNLVSQSWLLSQAVLDSPECATLLDSIMVMGGNWERAFGGVLLVHTPAGSHAEIADRIRQLTALHQGANDPLSDTRS